MIATKPGLTPADPVSVRLTQLAARGQCARSVPARTAPERRGDSWSARTRCGGAIAYSLALGLNAPLRRRKWKTLAELPAASTWYS